MKSSCIHLFFNKNISVVEKWNVVPLAGISNQIELENALVRCTMKHETYDNKFYFWYEFNVLATKTSLLPGIYLFLFLSVIDSPEILLFPTIAFRAAAVIWKHSYSVVDNGVKQGLSYKQLSNGSVDNLAQILYHLKGNIKELPQLLNIWKRIRIVGVWLPCIFWTFHFKFSPKNIYLIG